jgi:hypothetical protein
LKKSENRNFQGKRFCTKSWKKGRKIIFFQIFLRESSTKDVLSQKNKFLNLAGYTLLKYVISGKPQIAPEPEVGKFQNCPEMKVNYPTNKENTPEDFSDNFHNIKNFVQVDLSEKPPHFIHEKPPEKPPVAGKFLRRAKSITY